MNSNNGLLGYIIIADLDSKTEIKKAILNRLKTTYGFENFTPPLRRKQKEVVYNSLELRRMIVDIIESWQGRSLRKNGGVYFVPAFQAPKLKQLDCFMGDLKPYGAKTSLSCIPVFDRLDTKQELATNTRDSFMRKVVASQEDFVRSGNAKRRRGIKADTMQNRIKQYQQLSHEMTIYAELLGTIVEDMQQELQELERKAQKVKVQEEVKKQKKAGREQIEISVNITVSHHLKSQRVKKSKRNLGVA